MLFRTLCYVEVCRSHAVHELKVVSLLSLVVRELVDVSLGFIRYEGIALGIYLRHIANAETVVSNRAAIEAVCYMHLSEPHAWHTLHATLAPPAVAECYSQVAVVARHAVVIAYEVRETVVGSFLFSCADRGQFVAELTPRKCHVVSTFHYIDVAVHAVVKLAMVNPEVVATLQTQTVVAANVKRATTTEHHITENHVLSILKIQHTTLVVGALSISWVHQFCPRQTIDGQIAILHVQPLLHRYLAINIDGKGSCLTVQRILKLSKSLYCSLIFVLSASRLAHSSPTYDVISVMLR